MCQRGTYSKMGEVFLLVSNADDTFSFWFDGSESAKLTDSKGFFLLIPVCLFFHRSGWGIAVLGAKVSSRKGN